MNVSRGRIGKLSELVVDTDLDFLGTYQTKNLAAPASGEALRKGNKDIANAEVADAAAIAYGKLALTGAVLAADIAAAAGIPYSKLTLTGAILMADLATAIKNAANGIAVLDASADVPDPQIPSISASKITTGRFPKERLQFTLNKLLKGAGATSTPTEIDVPSAGSTLVVAETEVFDSTQPTSWTDLDLNAVVGANAALVLLKVRGNSQLAVAFRKNGDSDEFYSATNDDAAYGCALVHFGGVHAVFAVATDDSGIVEWIGEGAESGITVDIIAFIA